MSHLREPLDKQHGKRALVLFKSASHHQHHIHWSLPKQLSWKKSLFLTCQILVLLVNTSAADEKHLFLHRDNLTIPTQMELSQKRIRFSQFLAAFWKSKLNFEQFEKKDDPQDDKQHVKPAQARLKSASQHFYHIHWSLTRKLSWKNSLLYTCLILGLLVNTLAADEKYPHLNRHNLRIPSQMQLPGKRETFSVFFAAFLKSIWNFERFEQKDDPHSFCFSEITDSENVVT